MNKKIIATSLLCVLAFGYQANAEVKYDEVDIELNKQPATVSKEYFQCYALPDGDKEKCIDKLTKKYIPNKFKSDKQWVNEFTFEAEKRGFQQFLKENNKDCNKIEEGPLFNDKKYAYEVKCVNGNIFYTTFDSTNNIWSVVEK